MLFEKRPLHDRLVEKVAFPEDPEAFWTGCWLWTGALNNKGYPTSWDGTKAAYAHRLSFSLWRGPIPDGLTIDHLCFTPRCINPLHLDACTHAENVERSRVAGRQAQAHWARKKTHCKHGHPFDLLNTRWVDGRRHCRACRKEIDRRNQAKRKRAS